MIAWFVFYIKKFLFYRTITSNVNGARTWKFHSNLCLFYPCFLLLKLTIPRIVEEGKRPSLFLFAIFTHSHPFRHFISSFCMWHNHLLFLTTAHVLTTLLFDNIVSPLEFRIWSNVNFMIHAGFIFRGFCYSNFPQDRCIWT